MQNNALTYIIIAILFANLLVLHKDPSWNAEKKCDRYEIVSNWWGFLPDERMRDKQNAVGTSSRLRFAANCVDKIDRSKIGQTNNFIQLLNFYCKWQYEATATKIARVKLASLSQIISQWKLREDKLSTITCAKLKHHCESVGNWYYWWNWYLIYVLLTDTRQITVICY